MTSKGFFVTGTDTGVGKTVVCAALTRALVARGLRVAVMKPLTPYAESMGIAHHGLIDRVVSAFRK